MKFLNARKGEAPMQRTEKQDIYTRITTQIVSHLEKGVRPWVKPWNAGRRKPEKTLAVVYEGRAILLARFVELSVS
jgi:antirestriction protein ArdC